jgi:hypothetical protein
MDLRRILMIVAGVVVLALGLAQLTGGLNMLFGPEGDPAIVAAAAKAKASADAFANLAKDATTTGNAPRQTDPTAAPLLDAVFDVSATGAKPLGRGDLSPLAEWSEAGGKVGSVYILAGTGTTDVATAANDPNASELVDRNTITYAPELGRYMDQQIVLQGLIAEIVATDAPGSANDQVRNGITTTFEGVLGTLPLSGLDTGWRRARVAALAGSAPRVAKLLQAAQCASLRATSDAAATAIPEPEVKDQLKAFNAALAC